MQYLILLQWIQTVLAINARFNITVELNAFNWTTIIECIMDESNVVHMVQNWTCHNTSKGSQHVLEVL